MISEAFVGSLHPALVHFPIVLIWVALVCDVLCLFGNRQAGIIAAWMILAAGALAIPTVITGLEASDAFPASDPAVERHELLALITAAVLWIYAIVRGYSLWTQKFLSPIVYALVSLLLAGSVSLAADAGGVVTRGSSPLHPRTAKHEHASGQESVTNSSLAQVQKVFVDNACAQCHANVFDADGFPKNISKRVAVLGNHMGTMLPRNADGSLDKPEHSSFYRTVITKNTMPVRQNGAPGLTDAERLILLEWLIQGAPVTQ